MSMHERPADLEKQREVMEIIHRKVLLPTPFIGEHFNLIEVKTMPETESHDYDVWLWHLQIGIVEIKCRNYTAEFFRKHGYMLDRPKLKYLWRMNQRGFRAMFAFLTSDGFIFYTTMDRLLEGRDEWNEAAPERMSTTNHGEERRSEPFKGYDLPLSLFTEVC